MTSNNNDLLGNYILGAVFDSNDQNRKNAEQCLFEFRQNNANEYFTILGQNISNQNIERNLKIAHFTIMASSLKEKFQEKTYWEWMSDDMRNGTKNLGLQFLTDKDNGILRAAASFVAEIFMMELKRPENKWTILLDTLANNVTNNDFNIKKASILTISYICELVGQDDVGLTLDEIEKMLQCICVAIDKPTNQSKIEVELRTEGLKAFQQASETFCNLMNNRENVRTFTLNKFVENVILLYQNNNGDWIPTIAWQCLGETVKFMYQNLNQYFDVLAVNSFEAMKDTNVDNSIKIAATEFWSLVAEEEIYRKSNSDQGNPNDKAYSKKTNNFLANYYERLLQHLCPNLQSVEENEIIEESSNTLFASTASCLYLVLELVRDKAKKIITDFVSAFIFNDNWKDQVACLKAFQYLIMNSSQPLAKKLLDDTKSSIMNMFNSQYCQVRYAAEQFLCSSASQHFVYMGTRLFMENDYDNLLERLRIGDAKDIEQVAKIIEMLSGSSKLNEIQDPILAHKLNPTIECLVQAATNDKLTYENCNTIDACFSALIAIIPNYFTIQKNFENVQKLMQVSDNLSPGISRENRILIKSNVYMVIIFILGNFWRSRTYNHFDDKKMERYNNTIFRPLIEHINNTFEREGQIFEDGIMIFGYLSNVMQGYFSDYFNDVWPLVNKNLGNLNTSEVLLMKASFEATVNFSIAGLQSSEDIYKCTKILLKNIKSPELSQEMKPQMFGYLQEFIMADCSILKRDEILVEILTLLDFAYKFISGDQKKKDRCFFEYLKTFKESIIECLTCIISAIRDSNEIFTVEEFNQIYGHFEILKNFIFDTCDPENDPSIEYIRDSVNLMMDYVQIFPMKYNDNHCLTVELLKKLNVPEFQKITLTLHTYVGEIPEVKQTIEYFYGVSQKYIRVSNDISSQIINVHNNNSQQQQSFF